MPTKIRLQRHGKKAAPFFHLVVTDSRAPRDGKFIEKLGIYNPLTKPATIEIDFDRALYWVSTGAQTSDTAKAILSYKGVLLKNHLQIGVKKGALTQEQADAKFEKWLSEKQSKIEMQIKNYDQAGRDKMKKRLEIEKKVREEREKLLAAKLKTEATNEEQNQIDAENTAIEEAPVAEVKEDVKEEIADVPGVEETPVAENGDVNEIEGGEEKKED